MIIISVLCKFSPFFDIYQKKLHIFWGIEQKKPPFREGMRDNGVDGECNSLTLSTYIRIAQRGRSR